VALSTASGPGLVITAGDSGASPGARRCCSRRSGVLGRLGGPADPPPGSRGRSGSARQRGRQPAAGSVWVRKRRWLAGCFGRSGAAARRSAVSRASLAPWLAARSELQQRSWSVGGCSRAGPGRRPRSMTISIPSSSGWREAGSVSTRAATWARNPGPKARHLRGVKQQLGRWFVPRPGGRCRAGP